MNISPITAGSGEDSGQGKSSEVMSLATPSTATRGFIAGSRELAEADARTRTEAEARVAFARLQELAGGARAATLAWTNFSYLNTNGMAIDEQVAFDLERDRLEAARYQANALYGRARSEYAKTGTVTL